MSMRSTVLTLRTVKRAGQNSLAIESSIPGVSGSSNSGTSNNNNTASTAPRKTAPNITNETNVQDVKSHIDEPIQLTAAFHDMRTSSEIVLIDVSQLPGAKEGDVAELQPVEESDDSRRRKLLFVVKQMNSELQRRAKTTQVSIVSGSLQNLLGFTSRSPVTVKLKDPETVEADLVEIMIRDIGLSRGDMWELSSLLNHSCVFKNQKLTFLDTIRATVGTIYKMGKKTFSAYIGKNTKIVFRSESARLVFLIQITEEMYHFQEDGEIMFHKVVNSLFPTIFKRWREEDTHHLITIVFVANVDFSSASWNELNEGDRPKHTKDYYRVVVDQVNVMRWNEIMISLRFEFANFRKDIIRDQTKKNMETSSRFLPTIKSDILGTISLSTTLVMDRFRDPDLRHTTNHFIVISAGNGLYDVSYDDLLDTGKRLLNSEISVDIVCLAQPPLHVTPLFRYKDYTGDIHYCVPGWIDVSYWTEPSLKNRSQWLPKCKIYELQMMGIMENDMSSVTVEYLKIPSNGNSAVEVMDAYDKDIFSASVTTEDSRPNSHTSLMSETSQNLLMPSLPRRLPSNSSLRWKVSNSSISKAVPTTASAPIFSSVSKTALSSLQEYTTPKKKISEKNLKTSSIPSSASSINSSARSIFGMSIPLPKSAGPVSKTHHLQHHSQYQQAPNSISPSSSPSNSNLIKEKKLTVADSLRALMWTEIENISQRIDPSEFKGFNVGKWQDVFPEDIQRRSIKWRSLSSPSELPVTTPVFPKLDDFNENFTFQTHSISLSDENEKFMTCGDLMREMIHLRLMLGFQICHGPKVEKVESKRQSEGNSSLLVKYLDQKEELLLGARIYLSLDDEIHRIMYNYDGSINVQRYHRVHINEPQQPKQSASNITVKTRYQRTYHPYNPDSKLIRPQVFNWNKYDQLLAGYIDEDDDDNKLNVNRIKFVLLPAEIPKSTYIANDNKEMLSAEETRVEGLRRLIATLHRGNFRPGGRSNVSRKQVKEEALPEISFYTGDLVSFLEEQFIDSGNLKKVDSIAANSQIGTQQELNRDIPLHELYVLLKGNKGVRLNDRRWHWKIHKNSFIGLELVSWLVENFDDINTREEASDYGNQLMEKGLLSHVENRHKFLDGYYFYFLIQPEVSPDSPALPENEQAKSSRSNSMNSSNGKPGSRLSMTPVIFPQGDDIPTGPSGGNSLKKIKSEASEISRVQTNASTGTGNQSTKEKQTVVLSHSLKFNLDPNRISYKPETMIVHYDTVHNPNHCFHIRLEWLTATPKLIDDTINSWSRMCERYGLLLVETPWNELCEIPRLNPFHSYVDIRLAINPWTDPEFYNEEMFRTQKFYFHIYLLEYSGFLMDNRASLFFNNEGENNLEIRYSWGKPRFKYAQYIHRTGAYIAEIRDTGDLYLAPNNTHVSRVNVGNISSQQKAPSFVLDSQKIMLEFRATCFSTEKLKKIFLKAKEQWNNAICGERLNLIPNDDLLTI